MTHRLRDAAYRQLTGDPAGDGSLTPLNRFLVAVIVAAVVFDVLSTEAELTRMLPAFFPLAGQIFGLIFLVEYLFRLWATASAPGPGSAFRKRMDFALSPLSLIDLLVVIVTLMPMFVSNLTMLRTMRLLRLMTVARLDRFSIALRELSQSIYERRFELAVTLALAGFLLLFGATALYIAEGDVQPQKFGSIPRALWWSIITLTTVGYGDVSPITPIGKILASLVAIAGIGLVAMPTGIMAAAFSEAMRNRRKAAPKSDET